MKVVNKITINIEDLPDAILLLSNITRKQWDMAMEEYKATKNIPVILGLDPSIKPTIQIFRPKEQFAKMEEVTLDEFLRIMDDGQ